MYKEMECLLTMPITVHACLRARRLALHSNHSVYYASHSRAASTNTNPAPASAIPAIIAGQEI